MSDYIDREIAGRFLTVSRGKNGKYFAVASLDEDQAERSVKKMEFLGDEVLFKSWENRDDNSTH
jgi:hypothetical protein